MSLIIVMAIIGLIAGAAVVVLAVAQLTCEHAASPVPSRVTTILFGIVSAFVAIDCWEALTNPKELIEPMAIAFCIVLTMSWGYRRFTRKGSFQQAPPPAKTH